MTLEQLLNSKEVIDYDFSVKGTAIFELIKSNNGNYSIRQAFYNVKCGECRGFKVVKLLGTNVDYIAQNDFENFVAEANEKLANL